MTCAVVRGQLTERALGTLPTADGVAVNRHLQWCAACRKEADQMNAAAAVLAFAAPAADPDPELEDRVVASVQRRAARSHHKHVPKGRLATAAVAAAMVAVLGLGWGAVMAGRAARSEATAQAAQQRQATAFERFQHLIRTMEFLDPHNVVAIGQLSSRSGGRGGGSALTLVSPTIMDQAVVMMTGLAQPVPHALPYTVRILGAGKPTLRVGKITGLDASGAAMINHDFAGSLVGYDRIQVRTAQGKLVLDGVLGTRAALASPSP
jgi:hypothetical protein